MTNFVLLYSDGDMADSAAEQAATMDDWGAWFGGLGSALVDGGNQFTSTAKSIASNGKVSDSPAGTLATGYTIIKAESLNDAIEKAKGCPLLRSGGKISVYETIPM